VHLNDFVLHKNAKVSFSHASCGEVDSVSEMRLDSSEKSRLTAASPEEEARFEIDFPTLRRSGELDRRTVF
jgi:hypothetical protein